MYFQCFTRISLPASQILCVLSLWTSGAIAPDPGAGSIFFLPENRSVRDACQWTPWRPTHNTIRRKRTCSLSNERTPNPRNKHRRKNADVRRGFRGFNRGIRLKSESEVSAMDKSSCKIDSTVKMLQNKFSLRHHKLTPDGIPSFSFQGHGIITGWSIQLSTAVVCTTCVILLTLSSLGR